MNPVTKIISALQAVADHPLNRQNKFKAVWRYGFIQIAARLVPGEICVEFPNKTRLLVSPQMKGAAHYITPRLFEFEEMAFVMHFLRPEEMFADVGANIGAFTILAAGAAGARATAFEASPETSEMLSRNVRLNGLQDRVKVVQAAAGRTTGVVQFSVGLGTENRVDAKREGGNSATVKMTTLDQEMGSDPPTLLKVDVEGFEAEVFAGAANILKNSKLQAMIVEHNGAGADYGFDEDRLHREIRGLGFVPCNYQPFERRLFRVGENARGNIIYARNIDAANERLRSAPQFSLDDFMV
jgi:FkbM family methyltransferase